MRKYEGLSLVEVIVSIAIIGIIAASLLAAMASNIRFLERNEQITSEAFEMQREMETIIENTRNNLTSLVTINNVFEAGVTIQLQQVTHVRGTNRLFTLIASTRPPELPVPILTSVSASLRTSGTPVKNAYATSTTSILGSFTLDPATSSHFMVNSYYWYVSRAGFNMPSSSSPAEIEMGIKYPKFPDDYRLISTTNLNTLADVTPYGGRHIVFTATPSSKIGKLGDMVVSTPIYISGLPIVSSDIMLHLDGSLINPEASSEVEISGTNTLVEKWIDLSQNAKNGLQTNTNRMPFLREEPIGGDFVGQYVECDNNRYLQVAHSGLSGQTLTVFAVVKGIETNNILVNGATTIGATGSAIGNGWRLVKQQYTSNSNSITIGDDPLKIAELVIYRGAMTVSNQTAVEDYLKEKFVPLDLIGVINSLYNSSDSIKQNLTYTPPTTVLAAMAFGPDKHVPVTWTGTINTSVPGSFVLTGRATSDTTKTCSLTVTVTPIIPVNSVTVTPDEVTIKIGEVGTLLAAILPADADNKSVIWSVDDNTIASVDLNGQYLGLKTGTAIITATNVDSGEQDSSTINVISGSLLPAGLVLHLDASEAKVVSGNQVSEWTDLSSFSNDFTQGITDRQPIVITKGLANKDVISFNGFYSQFLTSNQQTLDTVNFYANNTADFSVFSVAQVENGSGTRTILGKSGGWGGSATYAMGMYDNDFAQVIRGNSTNRSIGNNRFNLHTTRLNGNIHQFWINGVERLSHNSKGAAALQANNVVIGATANGTSSFLTGRIAEILIFNRALSEDERLYVNQYLMTKWLVKKGFEFSTSSEGWSTGVGVSGLNHLSSGVIQGTIDGSKSYTDQHIISDTGLAIDANNAKRLHIRMASTGNNATAYLEYYKLGSWYYKAFTMINNGTLQDIYLDMSSDINWSGAISQLRIYPSWQATSGDVTIDFLRVLE